MFKFELPSPAAAAAGGLGLAGSAGPGPDPATPVSVRIQPEPVAGGYRANFQVNHAIMTRDVCHTDVTLPGWHTSPRTAAR
jgi:hypothetical protein